MIYAGTLQVPVLSGSPGLEGTGNWVAPSPGTPITTLTWTVSRDSDNDPWLYCYDFSSTAKGELSHIVIEVSPPIDDDSGFTEDDVVEGSASTSYELGWATSENGNQIFFESFKTPVWGDVYVKDGKAGGQGLNTVWNAGFLDANPTDPYTADPADMNFHILRPDTENGGGEPPIPEPTGLGFIGLALLAVRKRRS